MKILLTAVAGLAFTAGGITGYAVHPADTTERERADRLQESLWFAMRHYHPEVHDEEPPPWK